MRDAENQPPSSELPNDLTDVYLREISEIPRLTSEEVVAAAQAIREGKAAAALLEQDMVLREEVGSYAERVALGEEAERQMILANTPLVVSQAKRYTGRGIEFADLIQEGNLGLIQAVDRFDPDKGYEFSTFAVWPIRTRMRRALQRGKSPRVPFGMQNDITSVRNTRAELNTRGEDVSPDVLSERSGLDQKRVKDALVAELFLQMRNLSLNEPIIGREGPTETSRDEFIEDVSAADPETIAINKEQVTQLLGLLTPKEREAITLRFGLDDGVDRGLKEIAQRLGVTHQAVGQTVRRGLSKMLAFFEPDDQES